MTTVSNLLLLHTLAGAPAWAAEGAPPPSMVPSASLCAAPAREEVGR